MEKYSEEVALLVAQTGPLSGQRWALRRSLLLGREASCDVVIADRQVSRHHARIHVTPAGIKLEDLGSKNSTHVNGRAIQEEILLEDGDIIQIALVQKFVFLSSDATVPLDAQETILGLAQSEFAPQATTGGRLRLEKRSHRVWIKASASSSAPEGDPPTEIEILPPLSASQFRMLELLYENQGRVVPRSELVSAVWGEKHAYDVSEQALDALIRRLRDRIANIDPTHVYVITVRGHGLRLDNPAE
jgi:hypothetical protein